MLYVKRPWSHPEPKKPIVQRQLTANPSENPVLAASISLDGKQLAYYDRGKGLTLMLVDSGEKRTFPNSATMIPQDWYPDGTHLLVGGGGFTKTVQKMSVLDGTTKRILDLGEDFDLTLSPDGSQIAFVKDLSKGDMWLMTADVGEPRRILSVAPAKIYSFTWSPSSRRIIYLRYSPKEIALESCDTDGGHLVSALVNSRFQGANGLGGLAWLGNGSVLFRLSEPAPNKKFDNIWSLNVDPDTGRVRGQPIEVTTGPGFSPRRFSASSDGKRFVYLRSRTADSARIAKLQPVTGELGGFQLLAGEEWDKWPVGWSKDSQSVIFLSKPQGNLGIFQQNLRTRNTEPLVSGPNRYRRPVLTPDGLSLLFTQTDSGGTSGNSMSIMRMPIGGGPATLVLKGTYSYDCALRANVCVLSYIKDDKRAFAYLDPVKGPGRDFAQAATTSMPEWRLSPDGKNIALFPEQEQSKIQILPVDGSRSQYIDITGVRLQSLAWSSDNQHLYVSGGLGPGWVILRVGLDGKFQKLSETAGGEGWLFLAGPSPDEHYLSYGLRTLEANAVMLENF